MIFLMVLFMLSIFGVMGYVAYYQIQKTDPRKVDTSLKDDITTAQELLPFEDIKDGMIILGGHKYRGIIECTSTNYTLKTDAEKEIIELAFQRFLNSLTFPITMFVQTQTIDNTEMMETLRNDLEETVKEYPNLIEYANQYYEDLGSISDRIQNNKRKRKYIIVPYEGSAGLEKLSDAEKYKDSASELYNRCLMITSGLNAVGVKGKILSTAEIAELIYSSYHKDNHGFVKGITSGEYQSLLVEGKENKLQKLSGDGFIDLILYETEMRLKNSVLLVENPDYVKRNADNCLRELEKIREKYAGYFKE